MIIKVDLDGLSDAAGTINRQANQLAAPIADLKSALAKVKASPELSTYLPGGIAPVEGPAQRIHTDLVQHARDLVAFHEAVIQSDTFVHDQPTHMVELPPGTGQVDEADLAAANPFLGGPPITTDFGTVRQRVGEWELLGDDGEWYPIDLPRSDAADYGYTIMDQHQGLQYTKDSRDGGDRVHDGLVAAYVDLTGTPATSFGPAPGGYYKDLEIGSNGVPRYDYEIDNEEFGNSVVGPRTPPSSPPAGTGGGAVLTPGRGLSGPGLIKGKVLSAGLHGLAAGIRDDDEAYAVNITLEQSDTGGRRAVIQSYTVLEAGIVKQAAVVGFEPDGRPIVQMLDDVEPQSMSYAADRFPAKLEQRHGEVIVP